MLQCLQFPQTDLADGAEIADVPAGLRLTWLIEWRMLKYQEYPETDLVD